MHSGDSTSRYTSALISSWKFGRICIAWASPFSIKCYPAATSWSVESCAMQRSLCTFPIRGRRKFAPVGHPTCYSSLVSFMPFMNSFIYSFPIGTFSGKWWIRRVSFFFSRSFQGQASFGATNSTWPHNSGLWHCLALQACSSVPVRTCYSR